MRGQRTGEEPIAVGAEKTRHCLREFWAWYASDLLNNTLRGAYCEFFVAAAVGADLSGVHDDWAAFDVLFEGIRIEVKSASYLQAWEQKKPSDIRFSIRPARAWEPLGGYGEEVVRHADVYVFCLFLEKDREKADPLQMEQWVFYVLPAERINEACGAQKSISLRSLLRLNPARADYFGLKNVILAAAPSKNENKGSSV